ncbi:MAG: hypothetical protein HC869_20320, partial [Rhodospirillales bacterium]|nr:hypothetical protein [Rhodospirillales bacterium]
RLPRRWFPRLAVVASAAVDRDGGGFRSDRGPRPDGDGGGFRGPRGPRPDRDDVRPPRAASGTESE